MATNTPLEAFNNAFGAGVAEYLRDVAEATLSDDDLAVLTDPDSTNEERLAVGYTVRRQVLTNGLVRITVVQNRGFNNNIAEYSILGVADFKVQPDLSWVKVKELRGKELLDGQAE